MACILTWCQVRLSTPDIQIVGPRTLRHTTFAFSHLPSELDLQSQWQRTSIQILLYLYHFLFSYLDTTVAAYHFYPQLHKRLFSQSTDPFQSHPLASLQNNIVLYLFASFLFFKVQSSYDSQREGNLSGLPRQENPSLPRQQNLGLSTQFGLDQPYSNPYSRQPYNYPAGLPPNNVPFSTFNASSMLGRYPMSIHGKHLLCVLLLPLSLPKEAGNMSKWNN